jgi:hypothetical protein
MNIFITGTTHLNPYSRAGIGPTGLSPVRDDQLLRALKNFLFDKRLYPLFLSRANTSNVGVNSKYKKQT